MLSLMKRKTTPCETRNLRGDTSTLGFDQHKIAVTICARKEQHQEHVIATTTERPAQHSPWNTKTNCPKPSWQQSAFRDKLVATARQHHTNLHNLPHSNWNDIKSTSIRAFASVRWPARQSRCTVTDNVEQSFVTFSFTSYAVSFVRRYISHAAHTVRFRECVRVRWVLSVVGSRRARSQFGSRDSDFSAIRWTHNRISGTPLNSPSQAPLDRKGVALISHMSTQQHSSGCQ